MAYGKFNSYEDAATTFNIQLLELSFVQESPFQISAVATTAGGGGGQR